MTVYKFTIFSFDDLGIPPWQYMGTTYPPIATLVQEPNGTYTVDPALQTDWVFLNDDDPNFEDEQDNSQTGTGDIGDPGLNQVLAADLFVDGTQQGTTGEFLWAVATSEIFNGNTGETGFLYYISNNQNAYPNTSSLEDIIGFASDIAINANDTITIGPINAVAAVPYAELVCFTTGALIDAPGGPKPVEILKVGDIVRTADHGGQPIRYIGHRRLKQLDLILNPDLYPIEIAPSAGILPGLRRSVRVSPQHRFVLSGPECELLFGTREVFATAKSLLGQAGVRRVCEVDVVDYYHIVLDRHAIIFAEGAATESLCMGPGYLKGLPHESRAELAAIFPEWHTILGETAVPCLPTLKLYEPQLVLP